MKLSIRFFNDQEVRAIWDEVHSKWRFSDTSIDGQSKKKAYTLFESYLIDEFEMVG
jgi:cell filamentation protein